MRFSMIVAATLVASSTGHAFAGGFAPAIEEVAEPIVVVESEQSRPSYGILLPLLVAGGLIATASSSDDTTD